MRVTAAFKRLLDLSGVTVTDVAFGPAKVVVTVRLRSRRLHCPKCDFTTKAEQLDGLHSTGKAVANGTELNQVGRPGKKESSRSSITVDLGLDLTSSWQIRSE